MAKCQLNIFNNIPIGYYDGVFSIERNTLLLSFNYWLLWWRVQIFGNERIWCQGILNDIVYTRRFFFSFFSAIPTYKYADGEVLVRCIYHKGNGSHFMTCRGSFGCRGSVECISNQATVYTESLISPKSITPPPYCLTYNPFVCPRKNVTLWKMKKICDLNIPFLPLCMTVRYSFLLFEVWCNLVLFGCAKNDQTSCLPMLP